MRTFPQPSAVTLLATILSTCLLLFLFQKIIWIVVPLLLALMLYYCLRPVVAALVVRGVRHKTAAQFVWLFLQLITIAIVLEMALLALAKSGTWQSDFGRYLAGGQNLLKKTAENLEQMAPIFRSMKMSEQVDILAQQFTDRFSNGNLLPIAMRVLKLLPSLLLIPYITYFMLNDSTRMKKYIIRSVPNAFFEKSLLLFSRLDSSLLNYFQGLILLTLLDTACLAGGLEILGIKNAIWLGLASAVLAWIPYLGSVIACIVVVVVAATDFPEKYWVAYACLVLFLSVRTLDDFIFVPLTIGRKLHVHPVLSILMLFLGAMVAGATGLILTLPLFGVVAVICETVSQVVTDRRLKARYRAARQLTSSQGYDGHC
jgi:predicted PurR-regulated permease PerM